MPGVAQRFWTASTLQGRRWLMEKRLEAVEHNDVAQLRELLSAQSQTKCRELTSALEIGVMKRSDAYTEIVDILLRHGANPDGQNGDGTPYIHLASDANCHRILTTLLAHGANVGVRRKEDGATALHRAASHGSVQCLIILLKAGIGVDTVDALGRTPLIAGAQRNQARVTEVLVEAGADVNITDNNNRSALYWAAYHDNMMLVDTLLVHGVSADVINQHSDVDGMTPLLLATHTGNVDILSHLVDAGASPDIRDAVTDVAPVIVAAQYQHLECLRLLVKAGADVSVTDANGSTPLVMLLADSEDIKVLLDAGANPNEPVFCLMLATMHQHVDTVRLFLQYGASVNNTDTDKLPLQVALYDGSLTLVKMLFVAGVAMATDLLWLREYLTDDSLHQRAQVDGSVSNGITWLRDVIDTYFKPGEVPRLKSSCRTSLRHYLGSRSLWPRIDSLQLPEALKSYLKLKELDGFCDNL